MNKTIKKTLALVMAILMVVTCFALVGCDKDEDEKTTTSATETSTNDEATVDEIPATTAPVVKKSVLGKIYKPTEAFRNGESVNLETVYGTGFAKHGDELVFNEDGTFTAYIGVTAGPDASTGTYEIKSGSEVVLTYNNDKTEAATAVTFNVDETIQQLRIAKGDVFVIFTRAE